MSFTIENFLSTDGAFCREERQYALLLYNCLCFGDKEVIEGILGDGVQVEKVFYEATLMRDLFCADRKVRLLDYDENQCMHQLEESDKEVAKRLNKLDARGDYVKNAESDCSYRGETFNEKLVYFLLNKYEEKYGKLADVQCNFFVNRNLGTNNFSSVKKEEIPNPYVRIAKVAKTMMNAKPDIAVFYRNNGRNKLVFLECKYCSGESAYEAVLENRDWLVHTEESGKEVAKQGNVQSQGQLLTQDLICEFICQVLGGAGEITECKIENSKSKMIKFVEAEKRCEADMEKEDQAAVNHVRNMITVDVALLRAKQENFRKRLDLIK